MRVEVTEFDRGQAGGRVNEDKVIAQMQTRVAELSVGPHDQLSIRQQPRLIRISNRLWEYGYTAQAQHGQCPGRELNSPGASIAQFMLYDYLGSIRVQSDLDRLCDMCPGFGRHLDADAVGDFADHRPFIIRNVRARHGFRRMPRTMPAAKMKLAVGSLERFFFQFREEIVFFLQGKAHDARGVGKIFQLKELILKQLCWL